MLALDDRIAASFAKCLLFQSQEHEFEVELVEVSDAHAIKKHLERLGCTVTEPDIRNRMIVKKAD